MVEGLNCRLNSGDSHRVGCRAEGRCNCGLVRGLNPDQRRDRPQQPVELDPLLRAAQTELASLRLSPTRNASTRAARAARS